MGGKRSFRRGRGGGGRGGGGRGRGKGGSDALKQQAEGQSLVSERKEPPARQSQQQHYNLGREEQSAPVKQPQEPPTDYHSGHDHTEYRTNNNSRRAGINPVTRALQKRIAAATIPRRQDPPDEIQSTASSHSSENRFNKNNRQVRGKIKSTDHFNHQYHDNVQRDSPQLDEEEQLQYEQYEDQHYHQHFLHPKQNISLEPDEVQEYSTSHRQFSLAPLSVEMTSVNTKASRERKAKKEERKLQQQQKAQRSQVSMGRYENVNSNQSDSDEVSDDYSYGNDDDDDDDDDNESSYHGITRHDEFYNYEEEEEDSDDDDEERPLRRSRHSNKLQKNRRSPPPFIMTRCEKYQNRALVAAFALVALLFVRDHSPWYKKHKAQVEYAKHHHQHQDGSEDDDNVRNVKLDPMAVYNSNDDDSTHTKDHDPTHKYIKEEDNKYNEHSAGERIASRPAQKSLNHGFMDESYENRPVAKNSASTAAAVAGVRIGGSKSEVNEEEAAFLKSVQGKTKQHSTKANVEKRDQSAPPPPPIPDNKNSPSDTTSVSSEVRISVDDLAAAGINAGTKSSVEEKTSSLSAEVVTSEQQHSMPSDATSFSSEVRQSVDNLGQATTAGTNAGTNSDINEQAPSLSAEVVTNEQQNSTPSDATSFSSEVRQSVDTLGQATTAGVNVGTESGVKEQTSSLSAEVVTSEQQNSMPSDATSFSSEVQQSVDTLGQATTAGVIAGTESGVKEQTSSFSAEVVSEQQNSTPSDATSFSSEVRQSVDNLGQATTAGVNAGNDSGVEKQPSSFSTEVVTSEQQQQQQQQIQPQQLPPTESNDSLVEWGDQQEQEATLDPAQNIANAPPPNNDPIVSPQSPNSSTLESSSSSNTGFKPMANDAMSGSAFMSNSLKAQDAQEVKEVYKNSYYRWNHSFRQNADEGDGRDVPVFWRIPRSASSTVEDVMSNCYHLTMASALGTRQGHDQDQTLSVVTFGNSRFVNVDMSNPTGIGRAKTMNLGASGMADAISTPFLYETASIFEDVPDSGKCFTMLRHPVDRAVSLYFRYQSDDSNPNTAQYKGLSIDEYAERSTESNWMVRFLTNKRAGALSWHDLESAKEVFGRKCLVGLVEKAEESIRRYERFFGWGDSINGENDACAGERFLKSDKRNQHDSFEGTNAWEVLRKKNEYDVLLYDYAKHLYTQQAALYESFN